MLQFDVIAVGKLKERFWKDACAEYVKRLGGYAKVNVRELADSTPAREAEALLSAIEGLGGSHVVLLDVKGTPTSSEQLAARIDTLALAGNSRLAFIIGGSEGVAANVAARAHESMSFGPITLPHNLARVVLLEQLYRACKINKGEPYHK